MRLFAGHAEATWYVVVCRASRTQWGGSLYDIIAPLVQSDQRLTVHTRQHEYGAQIVYVTFARDLGEEGAVGQLHWRPPFRRCPCSIAVLGECAPVIQLPSGRHWSRGGMS